MTDEGSLMATAYTLEIDQRPIYCIGADRYNQKENVWDVCRKNADVPTLPCCVKQQKTKIIKEENL